MRRQCAARPPRPELGYPPPFMATPRLRLGQLLVDAKLITEQALQEVLGRQGTDGRRLGTLLVEGGFINETQLTQILSHQLSVPWVSLLHIEFSRQLLNLVPHDVADRYCLVPIYVRHVRHQGDTLYVAMDDPTNEVGLGACREHAGLPVRAMIAPPLDIRNAIRVYYGSSGSMPAVTSAEAPEATSAPTAEGTRAAAAKAIEIETETKAPAAAPIEAPIEAAIEAAAPQSSRKAAALEQRIDAMLSADAAAEAKAKADESPEIETREISLGDATTRARAERLRAIVDQPPPASERDVESIPRPRGRAPRMVALTLLDGTTIPLPAKRRPRPELAADPDVEASRSRPVRSDPPGPDEAHALTARDLVTALRAVAQGADGSEVLGSNERWEAMFAALLSLMLKKHLIADWEFVDELKNLK